MFNNQYISREPDYSDLDLDFVKNPATGDVNILYGSKDISRSIRNLVLTNYYERKFHSIVGSDVTALLFDNFTPLTSVFIQNAIEALINSFEPRVKLSNIVVSEDIDNNGFNVTIQYIILNRNSPVTSTLFLERIR
jgi:phage baseplate assembly protein W